MGKSLWRKIIRLILDILIVLSLFVFVLGLAYFLHGSYEFFPTEEQQEKAKIFAVLLMIVGGIPCVTCVSFRRRVAIAEENEN